MPKTAKGCFLWQSLEIMVSVSVDPNAGGLCILGFPELGGFGGVLLILFRPVAQRIEFLAFISPLFLSLH